MANQCKFYKQVLQVSFDSGVTWVNIGETRKGDLYEYDSAECGAVTQYRWVDVTGAYTCDTTTHTKYQKTKKQYSTDGGSTWQDVSPAEYGTGAVIEYASTDCGYDPSYANQYLTFIPRSSGKFKFDSYIDSTVVNAVSYSLDGGSTWTRLPNDTYTPTVQAGQKIMWKGNFTSSFNPGSGVGFSNNFTSSVNYDIEGNIMSLVYGDNFQGKTNLSGTYGIFTNLFLHDFETGSPINTHNLILPATTLGDSCYDSMFWDCTGLTTTPELPATTLATGCYRSMFIGCTSLTTASQLPATTLANYCYLNMFNGCTGLTTAPVLSATTLANGCYYDMFRDCTRLTTAPSLPATTLANECYDGMFYGCTGLTSAPQLPATTLAGWCYPFMFKGCTSLTTAPVLSATTLAAGCYYAMFEGCTSLNYIKCLATNISATNCTTEWVDGVASSGTFVKNSSMSGWSRGINGIPTNWTVQNA